MNLKDFVDNTIEVIREDGIASYLPTLIFPDTHEVVAIEGIPDDVDHRQAIQKVILRSGHQEREFFFGVQSGRGLITTGHFRSGRPTEFMEIAETADGHTTAIIETCEWWKIS